jgi:hypothetical protein
VTDLFHELPFAEFRVSPLGGGVLRFCIPDLQLLHQKVATYAFHRSGRIDQAPARILRPYRINEDQEYKPYGESIHTRLWRLDDNL